MRTAGLLSLALALAVPVLLLALGAGQRPGEARDADPVPPRDDGRAGVVRATQGTVLVRPAGAQRFTPLQRGDLLLPGDTVRTEVRGAHLAELDLGGGSLVLGPGATVRLGGPRAARLLQGEIEVRAAAATAFDVTGAGDFHESVTGTLFARTQGSTTSAMPTEPRWLAGYRAATGDAWTGALTATIDGRDVDLAVVQHQVTVDIRDQIARTTIEQVFRNATDVRTEGVFRFPLPAGASISGFGMWIGNELVEADIVERQRARQIYEDILRRKKDPGLLEWEGGNLFQARVFPIEARGTKRVRIRYTQVLPLEGRSFRYRAPLTSEMLRQRPLEHLEVTLRIDSAIAIRDVRSPTHAVDLQRTDHTATVSLRMDGVQPDRDFEAIVELATPPDLVVLPHRRGDDGYFLVQVRPPTPEGQGFERTLVPEGKPLDVVLVADTSGSMTPGARAAQASFLRALVALLGAEDRVRLLAYDVEPVWLLAEASAPDATALGAALDALEARRSLGWSDVEAGLGAALDAVGAHGLVVHVGDGIGTTGDADPQALATRLAALAGADTGAAVHAVAPSSTYEAPVLTAMARMGGGSLREMDLAAPAATAAALLREALVPQLRDLSIRVDGVRTARVYPETLPNVAAGTQLAVLGRFAPTAEAAPVTVVVEGRGPDGPVAFRTQATFPATDGGNDFLPRLWARLHLDELLAQGADAQTQAEIVEFSERFGILTPYTSLLVLESDEDRETYGVARRVHMRDGERFFAEARDRVALEARRAAVQEAGSWRAFLRAAALREIAGLGREHQVPMPPQAASLEGATEVLREFAELDARQMALGEERMAKKGGWNAEEAEHGLVTATATRSALGGRMRGLASADDYGAGGDGESQGDSWGGAPAPSAAMPMSPKPASLRMETGAAADRAMEPEAIDEMEDLERSNEDLAYKLADARKSSYGRRQARGGGDPRLAGAQSLWNALRIAPWWDGLAWQPLPPAPLDLGALGFPPLPPGVAPVDPARADTPWEGDLRQRVEAVLLRERFLAVAGAWHVVVTTRDLHARRGTPLDASRIEGWVAADGWRLDARDVSGRGTQRAWWLGGERGGLDATRSLARRRAGAAGDERAWWLPIADLDRPGHLDSLERAYELTIAPQGDDRLVFTFTPRAPRPGQRLEWSVDGASGALLEERTVDEATGQVRARRVHEGVRTVAGLAFPTRIVSLDAKGRRTREQDVEVEHLAPAAWAAGREALRALDADVLVLDEPLPDHGAALTALGAGTARAADRLALILAALGRGDGQASLEHLAALRSLVKGGAAGLDALEALLLTRTRAPDAWPPLLERLALRAEAAPGDRGHALARFAYEAAARFLGPAERLALLERLEAALTRESDLLVPEEAAWRRLVHDRARLEPLGELQRGEEVAALVEAMARAHPGNVELQLQWNQVQRARGQRARSRAHLQALLETGGPWFEHEEDQLFTAWTDALWADRLLEDLDAATTAWTARRPANAQAWLRAATVATMRGRDAETDALLLSWLDAPPAAREAEADVARQSAAIELLLGNGWLFHVQRIPVTHAEALGAFAAAACQQDGEPQPWGWDMARRLLRDWRFRRTDAHARLLRDLRAQLGGDATRLAGVARLELLLGLVDWSADETAAAERTQVREALRDRWQATADRRDRARLAQLVLGLFDAAGEADAARAFQRQRIARLAAEGEPTEAVARDLVERLLREDAGDAAREDEVVAWVAGFAGRQEDERVAAADASTWARRLADRLETWRRAAVLGPPEALADLSREARRERDDAARDTAREQLVARMDELATRLPPAFAPWLGLEALAFSVQSGADIDARTSAALAQLVGGWVRERRPAERVQRERLATALAFATLKRTPPEGLADRLVEALGTIAAADLVALGDEGEVLLDARLHLARLLVGLDRADDLRTRLLSWQEPGAALDRWTVLLAFLEAERGDLASAVARLQAARERGPLAPDVLERLATWQLALGDDRGRIASETARWEALDPWQLVNLLNQRARALRRTGEGAGAELEPESLQQLAVLLAKAPDPRGYVGVLMTLYAPTKDHRVPAALVPGLTGHTQERAYAVLGALSQVVAGIHEEATLDALRAALEARGTEVPGAVDRRVLQLARSRVAARAAEVQQADPAHAAAARDALDRALGVDLVEGERLPLARYLAELGVQRDEGLAERQLAGLGRLLEGAAPASDERLRSGVILAQLLVAYNRHDGADALLEGLWRERRATQPARRDDPHMEVVRALVDLRAGRRQAERAEGVLLDELALALSDGRDDELLGRLFDVRTGALQGGLRTRLGEGVALYVALRDLLRARLEEAPDEAGAYLGRLVQVHRAAAEGSSRLAVARTDLVAWAFGPFRAWLRRTPLETDPHTMTVAQGLYVLRQPADALRLVLDVDDEAPRFLVRIDQDLMTRQIGSLARWRVEAGAAARGDLEARLWPRVAARLERHLTEGDHSARPFWQRRHGWAWPERFDDMAAVIEAVVERESGSEGTALRGARVLYDQMERHAAGIDMLEAALARTALGDNARRLLLDWLIQAGRAQRALPLARALVATYPDAWQDRARLSDVLAQLRQADALGAHLDATAARWRETKAFSPEVARALAEAALAGQLAPRALAWLDEAVRLRVEARGHAGGQDPWLAQTYQVLARARSAAGEGGLAFAAARAGLVLTSARNADAIREAVGTLDAVLADARDLQSIADAYAAEVAETGLDASLLQRAFARAWRKRGDLVRTEQHLLAAREVEPGDGAVHAALVEVYDALGRPADAIQALFGSIELAPLAYDAYEDLARRYAAAGDEAGRQRALTSLAEPAPHQAEGHRRLAEAFTREGRLGPALEQWAQVVRTERLDPTGWLAYAAAALRAKDVDLARRTYEHLLRETWEERFGDVKAQAAAGLARLPR
jgi:hypothetical protein